MENLRPGEGSGLGGAAGESSDSTFQLNILILDSRTISFHVDKNILVSAFKEKIASQVSVPVGQQHLSFRGKVLEDDHLLSEYNMEHGDTLDLVERQPPSPPGPNTREPTQVNITGGHYSHAGGSQNHIGQTGHGGPDFDQVYLQNVVRRIGILPPEEILFSLVNVAIRPSNSDDVSLVNAICSQSELAMGFMKKVLSELSRRIEVRGHLKSN